MTTQACAEPGCPGTIQDGYCDVCGAPAGGNPTGGALAAVAASWGTGTGTGAAASAPGSGTAEMQQPATGRTSSSRLASTALGSARMAPGSYQTRRVGTGSTRLRGHRLGAGLTTVPHTPVADPLQAVMATPELAENKRFCPTCGQPVGRAREGVPGRIAGFCGHCGARYDFAPALTAGDLVGGQYEVVGCLAHGGLGWIYLARDRNVSGRWVVLKGLLNSGDKEAYEAAVAERQYLAEVEHPLIVEIFNFVLHDGLGYTVMEFVGGKSLKDVLKERRDQGGGQARPLPVDQAIAYILEVLPAFSYLHDHDLLYCDFKPDNIIAQGDGVKLIDMGGVRRADDMTSAIYGTVGYQAPEVPEIGPSVASDIFTLGRTLASLVLDFRGNTTVYQASFPPVAETPVFQRYDSFYRWLAKACAPAPADRFATVDEARVQLLGVLREVVATDKGPAHTATTSAESLLFGVPPLDGAERPLTWDELPLLKVDSSDPMASWLAGVNVADPVERMVALSGAPEATVEVRLAFARAAIEAGDGGRLRALVAEILKEDPWEWRAAWLEGLGHLASNDPASARASFNAVYGQVPGEPAPKLALATVCELSGEPGVAEQLYTTIARADANYTGAAAFGLARVRAGAGALDGALGALDLVGPTRGSYPDARLRRARLLVSARRSLLDLSDAVAGLEAAHVPDRPRAEVTVDALAGALGLVTREGPDPAVRVAGAEATEPALRDRLELALRDLARLTEDRSERVALVDRANSVRRWTLR
ncbi:tetratricopeptide repeat protein [Promicromonospora thailandica]|uniref:non-specific serine/threonine protein kinase n=1 Tax=Promicromonospora thailandica TaxID=765201 RepID=A0A9X2JSU5_9MICO|nr:serine/threonine-protein kinase [Promicromonospora thailandica]MCP2262875.1 serine/threonine-protein kinase PknG [Promicromonospora thailandica]BFF18218.1 serine/threonine-protein kinase [Promicromonospora thailandica]